MVGMPTPTVVRYGWGMTFPPATIDGESHIKAPPSTSEVARPSEVGRGRLLADVGDVPEPPAARYEVVANGIITVKAPAARIYGDHIPAENTHKAPAATTRATRCAPSGACFVELRPRGCPFESHPAPGPHLTPPQPRGSLLAVSPLAIEVLVSLAPRTVRRVPRARVRERYLARSPERATEQLLGYPIHRCSTVGERVGSGRLSDRVGRRDTAGR